MYLAKALPIVHRSDVHVTHYRHNEDSKTRPRATPDVYLYTRLFIHLIIENERKRPNVSGIIQAPCCGATVCRTRMQSEGFQSKSTSIKLM
ncbi:hypothetical protein LSAT2_021464 [Lamellibrachia satsuma]|nr:hypothetical protein LSAT2_021464 [Lamellibrachia satsuma]